MAQLVSPSPPLDRPPLREALREATAHLHASLDRSAAGVITSRPRYVAFLRATRAVAPAVDAALARLPAWCEAAAPIGPFDRRARLDADLAALDAPPAPPLEPPAVTSLAEAFGCAYVLEGSLLGGAVLSRALAASLGLTPSSGLSYLSGVGDGRGARWRAFLAALEVAAAGFDDGDRAAACAAAVATFERFELALAREELAR